MNDEQLQHVEQHAQRLNVQPAALQAVIAVESAGSGFTDGLVTIRWEGHYFWRLLPENLRNIARSQGLADPRAQAVKNPRSMSARHALLERAKAIHPEAALKSISMGAGQVMGDHAERLGYRDVFAMWDANHSWEGQYDCMILYVEKFGLVDELQRRDWAGFARGYNGPNYRKFAYDTKLRNAFLSFGGTADGTVDPSLRMGDRRRSRVRALQQRLTELGFHVVADGDFGPGTKRGVQAFQLANGLTPDGIVGPNTQAALDVASVPNLFEERESATVREVAQRSRIASGANTLRNVGAVTATVVGGAEVAQETGVLEQVGQLTEQYETLETLVEPLSGAKEFVTDNIGVVAVIAAVALMFWANKILKARVQDHRTGKTV